MQIRYVDDAGGLADVQEELQGRDQIALDCEAAGYHRYSDRLCLIQLTAGETTFLIDPLAIDPGPSLAPVLQDEGVSVLMHGADYDVRLLGRDLSIGLSGLVDTQIAAGLLGEESIGLSAVLESRIGVNLSKKYQKADWAKRPLPAAMREYAAHDTAHLHALAEDLLRELHSKGRYEWAVEEFRELEKVRFEEAGGRDPVLRVRAAREMEPREVDRLRAAIGWRDDIARQRDRAPFRVAGDDALIEVAMHAPRTAAELAAIRGVRRAAEGSNGEDLLRRLNEVDATPEDQLVGYPRDSVNRNGTGRPPPEVEERLARLKKIRNARAEELEVARGVLLPNGILQILAAEPPPDLEALRATEGLRQWQAAVIGEALLEVL
jgi:ribonuclease D